MKIVYARLGSTEISEKGSFKRCEAAINSMEDDGEGFGIAIVDEKKSTAYIHQHDVAGVKKEDLIEQKKDALKEIGLSIAKIEFY